MNLGDIMLYIWLGVMIVLVLLEVISKNLFASCFCVSAIVSVLSTLFTNNYIIQVSLFLVIGILLVVFVRPNILELIKSIKDKKQTSKKVEEKKNKKSVKK